MKLMNGIWLRAGYRHIDTAAQYGVQEEGALVKSQDTATHADSGSQTAINPSEVGSLPTLKESGPSGTDSCKLQNKDVKVVVGFPPLQKKPAVAIRSTSGTTSAIGS